METIIESIAQNMPYGYKILIVGRDMGRAAGVANSLQPISRAITACRSFQEAHVLLAGRIFDILIVIPDSLNSWLKDIASVDEGIPESPPICKFCLLPGAYQGPDARVRGDRLGWTVIYEQH